MNKTILGALFVVYLLALALFCLFEHATLFAWPQGIVTGNLIASCIWAPLAVIHLDQLARRHHKEHKEQAEERHEDLKAHISEVSGHE